jgi:hypothetical protein
VVVVAGEERARKSQLPAYHATEFNFSSLSEFVLFFINFGSLFSIKAVREKRPVT